MEGLIKVSRRVGFVTAPPLSPRSEMNGMLVVSKSRRILFRDRGQVTVIVMEMDNRGSASLGTFKRVLFAESNISLNHTLGPTIYMVDGVDVTRLL